MSFTMIVLAGFISILVLTSVFSNYSGKQVDSDAAQLSVGATTPTIGKFNTFAYAAMLYMRDIQALPADGTIITWSQIRDELNGRNLALAFLQKDQDGNDSTGIPDTWKIVTSSATDDDYLFVNGDKRGFYVCADMADDAAATIARKIPAEFDYKVFNLEEDVGGNKIQYTALDKDATAAGKGVTQCKKP